MLRVVAVAVPRRGSLWTRVASTGAVRLTGVDSLRAACHVARRLPQLEVHVDGCLFRTPFFELTRFASSIFRTVFFELSLS